MKLLSVVVLLSVALVGIAAGQELRSFAEDTLTCDAASQYAVVYPDKASLPELTAARELAMHLSMASAERYEPVEENKFDGKRPAIYVGWTRYALSNGYRPSDLPDSAFEIGAVDNNIILCGSRPRGNLYAVAEYLEGMCGFRWFTFQGEVRVPSLKTLPLPKERKRYAPAFTSRDLFAPCPFTLNACPSPGYWTQNPSMKSIANVEASDRWMAMNRISGNAMATHHPLLVMPSKKYGGFYEPYMNSVAHTFSAYVGSGLCFSNREMREKFLLALREDIRRRGNYGIYSVSPPDGGGVCSCPECKSLNDKHASPSAAYVEFVNDLGRRIAAEFPEVRLEILAYSHFAAPPKDMVCEPNVHVRYAPIQKVMWDRVDDPGNEQVMRQLKGWSEVDPRQLRIWDYPHVYGHRDVKEKIYPVARTDRGERGVLEWVKKAAADRNVAQAGLCITMADDTSGSHYLSLDDGMNVLGSYPVIPKPTLMISYRGDHAVEMVELPAASVVRVSSDSPDSVPPMQAQFYSEAVQVTGNPKSQELKSFALTRFDLSALPPEARIVDATFELSKIGEEDVEADGTFAIYAVRPGATWDTATTWNTRPDVEAAPAFTLPAYKGKQGFQKYDCLFPQPNIFVLLENLRIYRKMGAKGMFMETDAGLLDQQCMADLVLWTLARGMWDTSRTPDELVMDFCTSYYGKAGTEVFNYLKLLDKAYAQDPVKIPTHLGYMPRQTFFSYKFAQDAQGIFDKAAAQVAQDPEIVERVLRARAPLDIATLFYYNRFNAEHRSSPGSSEPFAFDRKTIEQRYKKSRLTMIDRFYPRANKDTETEAIDGTFSAAKKMPTSW